MQNITTLKDDDVRLVKFIYHNSVLRFKGETINKFKTDLVEIGYIALLEYKKQNNLTSVGFEYNLSKYVSNAMHKELARLIRTEDKCISLNMRINASNFKRRDLLVEDVLKDNSIYFDSYDYNFLQQAVYQFLEDYTKEDKNILVNYFFKSDKIMKFCKDNNTSLLHVKNLVREYRQKLNKFLLENEYTYLFLADESKDEFSSTRREVVRLKNHREREKYKLNGITLYNVDDFKIYHLIRRDNNIKECAELLNIPIKRLNDILTHKVGNIKLFLYQIQALRKNFYPNYSLNDLRKVEVYKCLN